MTPHAVKKTALLSFVLALFVLASAPIAQAQTDIRPGIKAGVALGNIRGDDTDNLAYKLGFAAGGFVNIGLGGDGFAVQPEALFVQKGASADEGEGETTVSYLQVPVLGVYTFQAEGGIAPMVFAGPAFGFKVSESAQDFQGNDIDQDFFTSFELSLPFGAGVGIPAGNGTFMIDARFDLGLTNIADAPDEADITNQTNTFVITAGYAF